MTHKEILDELRQPVRALREHIPAVFEGYCALTGAVFVDGALDAKTKELIALAIAVTKQCDGCMAPTPPGLRGVPGVRSEMSATAAVGSDLARTSRAARCAGRGPSRTRPVPPRRPARAICHDWLIRMFADIGADPNIPFMTASSPPTSHWWGRAWQWGFSPGWAGPHFPSRSWRFASSTRFLPETSG